MRHSSKHRPVAKQRRQPRVPQAVAVLALLFFLVGLVIILPSLYRGESRQDQFRIVGRRSGWRGSGQTRMLRLATPPAAPVFMRPLQFLHKADWSVDALTEPDEGDKNVAEHVDGTPRAWRGWTLFERVPKETETGPVGRQRASTAAAEGLEGYTTDGGDITAHAGEHIAAPANSTLDAYCDLHFGETWLQQWNGTAQQFCRSQSQLMASNSRLSCRSIHDVHMTNSSAPHVLCDATELLLDISKFQKARCPKHRPHYLCQKPTYHQYAKGAFGLACSWPDIQLEDFPKDHLRDIMEAVQTFPEGLPQASAVEAEATLLVTREINEHANVFHTLTDLLNAYISIRILGWEAKPRQVVLLDNHPTAPLDRLWAAVAAGGGLTALGNPNNATRSGRHSYLRRAEDLAEKTVFQQAVFVPPGYTSLLYAHLYTANSCPQSTALFRGFRSWMLSALELPLHPVLQQRTLKVVVISRQPMMDPKTHRRKRKMVRRISNEEAVLHRLQQSPLVNTQLIDLATLSLLQQLTLIAETDILVGMHGAALAWSLLMHPQAALLELWPSTDGIWRCYEHTAEWAGILYRRWANSDPARVQVQHGNDATEIDVEEVGRIFDDLVLEVQGAKGIWHHR